MTHATNKLLVVLCILLLSVNVYLLYQKHRASGIVQPVAVKSIYEDKIHALNDRVVRDGHGASGYQLDKSISLTDSSGKSVDFDELFSGSNIAIFFRFSPPIHCQSCVNEAMGSLIRFSKKNADKKVILLATQCNPSDLKIITGKYGLLLPIYAVDQRYFPPDLEAREEPFFFVTDRTHFITNIFPVHFELAYLVPRYLDGLDRKNNAL